MVITDNKTEISKEKTLKTTEITTIILTIKTSTEATTIIKEQALRIVLFLILRRLPESLKSQPTAPQPQSLEALRKKHKTRKRANLDQFQPLVVNLRVQRRLRLRKTHQSQGLFLVLEATLTAISPSRNQIKDKKTSIKDKDLCGTIIKEIMLRMDREEDTGAEATTEVTKEAEVDSIEDRETEETIEDKAEADSIEEMATEEGKMMIETIDQTQNGTTDRSKQTTIPNKK